MNNLDTCMKYEEAIWSAVSAPTNSIHNQRSAIVSQIGAALSIADKERIQRDIEMRIRLRQCLGGTH